MYNIKISVWNEGYDDSGLHPNYQMGQKVFQVEIIDYCQPTSIDIVTSFSPNALVFTIGLGTQLLSSFDT